MAASDVQSTTLENTLNEVTGAEKDEVQRMLISPAHLTHVKRLGEGGSAQVDLYKWSPPGVSGPPTLLAVKGMRQQGLAASAADLQLFVHEAAQLGRLQHSCLVRYLGVGSFAGADGRESVFVAQEYMEGGSVHRVVWRAMTEVHSHVYSCEDALRWCHQVAQGLERLHAAKVAHRDVKLENVLLTSATPAEANAKLADYGLTALVKRQAPPAILISVTEDGPEEEGGQGGGGSGPSATEPGSPHSPKPLPGQSTSSRAAKSAAWRGLRYEATSHSGSLLHMAPEVFRRQGADERADVFSLGLVIYQLLQRHLLVAHVLHTSAAGTSTGKAVEEYARGVAHGYRPPFKKGIPPQLQELVATCWADSPADRPPASEVSSRLGALLAGGLGREMDEAERRAGCGCIVS